MLASLIPTILPTVTDIIGRFLPEDEEAKQKVKREIEAKLTDHLAQIDLAQIAVNREEAKGNWFQASWRPATGWCCVLALFWTYIACPIAQFVLAQTGHLIDLPSLDMSQMMPILLGLLGLGAYRSYERVKKVNR